MMPFKRTETLTCTGCGKDFISHRAIQIANSEAGKRTFCTHSCLRRTPEQLKKQQAIAQNRWNNNNPEKRMEITRRYRAKLLANPELQKALRERQKTWRLNNPEMHVRSAKKAAEKYVNANRAEVNLKSRERMHAKSRTFEGASQKAKTDLIRQFGPSVPNEAAEIKAIAYLINCYIKDNK